MKRSFVPRCFTCILALSLLSACQQKPPVRERAIEPAPFDEKADAKAAIRDAIGKAAFDGIRVLIIWGANDDKGCSSFLAALKAGAVSQSDFLSNEYRSVRINVGRLDRNTDLAKGYGAALKANALPALTVLDFAGRVLANTNAEALRSGADAAEMNPARLLGFLTLYKAPAPDAAASFEAAVKQAKKENKSVFAWFSAPW